VIEIVELVFQLFVLGKGPLKFPRPSCLKNTGPLESSLIKRAVSRKRGLVRARMQIDAHTSMIRLPYGRLKRLILAFKEQPALADLRDRNPGEDPFIKGGPIIDLQALKLEIHQGLVQGFFSFSSRVRTTLRGNSSLIRDMRDQGRAEVSIHPHAQSTCFFINKETF
jgi:hypothetical protein